MKKGRKENFGFFTQIAALASNIASQMGTGQADPEMIKSYLSAPDSPIKPEETFEKNYTAICEAMKTTCTSFLIKINNLTKVLNTI